jgi:hypothetical protein
VHEVEQIIEPAARLGRRPTVKLGLHPRYPLVRPCGPPRRSAGVHRRISRPCSILISSIPLPPFPMHRAFPGSEYYGGSAPSLAAQPTAGPARPPCWKHGDGQARDGSRVHCDSLTEGGARLCPSGLAASTPQAFPAASRSPVSRLPELPRHSLPLAGARRSWPRSARFEPVRALRSVMTPVPRVLLSGPLTRHTPSGSTGPPWLCQDCSHPSRRLPGQAVLSSSQAAATARRWWPFTSTRISSASRRTKQALQAFTIYFEGRIPTP